jgi:hypothetical protein
LTPLNLSVLLAYPTMSFPDEELYQPIERRRVGYPFGKILSDTVLARFWCDESARKPAAGPATRTRSLG